MDSNDLYQIMIDGTFKSVKYIYLIILYLNLFENSFKYIKVPESRLILFNGTQALNEG